MPFQIVRNDITLMQVDAIVNTANEFPTYSSGTDTAVYEAAGVEKLLAAREKIGFLNEGEVAITPGFNLPAQYIIHAVSPLYQGGNKGESERLRSCYNKSLQLAKEHGCKSIAFPLIATGGFGYPQEEGMEIALSCINQFLMKEDMMVYLVVFNKEAFHLSGKLFNDVQSYIDDHYVEEKIEVEYSYRCISEPAFSRPAEKKSRRSLDDVISQASETFQQQLFRLIDQSGEKDVTIYKKANVDKKLFHKIKINENYQPSKHTVICFSLALELSLDETKDLLARAGYALSPCNKRDLIIQYFIENKIYDIYTVDCVLYDYDQQMLGKYE